MSMDLCFNVAWVSYYANHKPRDITRQQERRARKQIAEKEGTNNRERLQLNFEVNKEDREGFFLVRLNTTMDINVTQIIPRGLCEVQDGELALQNEKSIAEIKDLEWNLETNISKGFIQFQHN